jgi:hypothetical protein
MWLGIVDGCLRWWLIRIWLILFYILLVLFLFILTIYVIRLLQYLSNILSVSLNNVSIIRKKNIENEENSDIYKELMKRKNLKKYHIYKVVKKTASYFSLC